MGSALEKIDVIILTKLSKSTTSFRGTAHVLWQFWHLFWFTERESIKKRLGKKGKDKTPKQTTCTVRSVV